jgi:hypothetical protein
MKEFSPETTEVIGSYVYALVDPRMSTTDRRRISYVGKGIGQRCLTVLCSCRRRSEMETKRRRNN